MIASGIDWKAKSEPWASIGPQFRRQCEAIVSGAAPFRSGPYRAKTAKPQKPERKHRDAVPPDPAHQKAVAWRQAEITEAKAALDAKHRLRAAGVTRNPNGQHKGQRYFADDDMNDAANEIARAASSAGE